MKYYHATKFENWASINVEGLRAGWDGLVHLTTDMNKAIQYVAMYNLKPVDVIVIEVKTKDVEQHYDGDASGNEHFVHEGGIRPELLEMAQVRTVGGPPPSRRQNSN